MNVVEIILKSLTQDEHYTRFVTSYLDKSYFQNKSQQTLYLICDSYFRKYNKCASPEVLRIESSKLKTLNEDLFNQVNEQIDRLEGITLEADLDWRIDETESFCQDRALVNALQQAIQIAQGGETRLSKTAIPQLMSDAIAVGFDSKLGHDYFDDADQAWEYYNDPATGLPFNVNILNEITGGGVRRKTLNLILAGVHTGKSLGLCHFSAGYLLSGLNVLYITMEMAEEEIRKRVDANLLNIKMDDIAFVPRETFVDRVERVRSNTKGRFKVKEYPTSGASVANFRAYINELKIKESFVPDVILVDYLNIVNSDRFKSADNSYSYQKSVAEELRGFAKELNVVVWSALQLNRAGLKDSDPSMTDISDCIRTDQLVSLHNGKTIEIGNLRVGDQIQSHDGLRNVLHIFPKKTKRCYRLTLESGKQIIVSADHKFPTSNGVMSISTGLSAGAVLHSRSDINAK
jgi:replicative DNA helicase